MRNRPLGIVVLVLGAVLASASAASAVVVSLPWATVTWSPGDLVHTYTLGSPPDDVDLTITVSSAAAGSFTTWNGTAGPTCLVATPGKDGTGQSTNFFGTLLDLGVIFEPTSSATTAPVLISLKFTNAGSGAGGPLKAVATLKFEISDVDTAAGGTYTGVCSIGAQGARRDQVAITADNSGSPVTTFTLTPKTGSPTFAISPFNTATGVDPLIATIANDNGGLTVNFGTSFVTNVLITYNENAFNASTNPDPGFRGIGVLGNLTYPVELMEFTVE